MGKIKSDALSLANLRKAPLDVDALSPGTKKQLLHVLKTQDGDTLAQARKNEESLLHGMEIVDLVDGAKKVAYRLFLYPFGDGTIYAGDTTKEIAAIVQHGAQLTEPDPELHARLKAAWDSGRKKLKVEQAFSFDDAKPKDASPDDDGDLLGPIYDLLGPWKPVPVRRPFEIRGELHERLVQWVKTDPDSADFWPFGVLDIRVSHELHRFLGLEPAGPCDRTIKVEGKEHPVWCLVSDVTVGLRAPDKVLELLFKALSEKELVACWNVLTAGRNEYSLDDYKYPSAKDYNSQIPLKIEPPHQAQMARKVDFLVAMGKRLGKALAKPRAKLSADLLKKGGPSDPFCAVVLLATTLADGKPFGKEEEALIAHVIQSAPADERPLRRAMCPLLDALPKARASALAKKKKAYATLVDDPKGRAPKSDAWFF